MNGVEKLREYADATKWGGECRILHAHHGDFAGDCSERECNECRAAYLRAIADEWHDSIPRENYDRRRAKLVAHIAECETALRKRNERIAELERRLRDSEARLMPEGMELDGNVLKIRTAENVDYDGETLFVLIGGRDDQMGGRGCLTA